MTDWPKGAYKWQEDDTLYISVPFTWNLPAVRNDLEQGSWFWKHAVVGGPAVDLMPDYLAGIPNVTVGGTMEGVLQRVNPGATRTTLGCVRKCAFCGIGTGRIEPGGFRELADWPDQPILCDNNLLAASDAHVERVCRRLQAHGWADFNQGLDARLMTTEKARMIAAIGKPKCRLSLDSASETAAVATAIDTLRGAGITKALISIYVLIAFDSDPAECWKRCLWVEEQGYTPCPMWYHALDCLKGNAVSEDQATLGWTEADRTHIMGYFYKRRGTPPEPAEDAPGAIRGVPVREQCSVRCPKQRQLREAQ